MALLTGDQGSFTYTGGQTLTVADFGMWTGNIDRPEHEYTPFGYPLNLVVAGTLRGSGELECAINGSSTTPPVPSGSSGTITLITTSGKNYTGPAILTQLGVRVRSAGGAPISMAVYRFVFSATSSSSTIASN